MSTTRKRLTMGAVLAIITLMVAGTVWWMFRRPPATVPLPPANSAAVPAAPIVVEKSIAVLPFDNFSEDKDSAFFADGVQDGVLTDLAKVADLKVISRTSVMLYKDPAKRSNLREIGKALGVTYVVEGSVQRAGNRIRVSAQLIEARTDGHKWAEQYDRDLANVFAIQSDVARSIATALQAKLASQEQTQFESQPPGNPQAYLLYLQANALVHVASSLEDALHADKLYTQAIALDPVSLSPAHPSAHDAGGDSGQSRSAAAELGVGSAATKSAIQSLVGRTRTKNDLQIAGRRISRQFFNSCYSVRCSTQPPATGGGGTGA